MSASSDDVFYSAPDSSPPNPNPSQDHQQPLSTPLNPNPHARTDQNQPPDKWLLRVASSAGKVLSSVLGLSDGSSSDDESEGDVADMPCLAEEKDEFVERIKELKQGRALGWVDEQKCRSEVAVEELVTQETLSRKQSEKQINPVQSWVVESPSPFVHPKDVSSQNQQVPLSPVQASLEISSAAGAKANKLSGEIKSTSSSFSLPLNPNTSPSPHQTQKLTLESTKPPLDIDPNHCLSPGQSQQYPSSNIVPPVNPLPSPSPDQNQQQPLANTSPSPRQTQQLTLESTTPPDVDPNQCLSPGRSQQHPPSNILPPENPLPSPSPGQNQQPPLANTSPSPRQTQQLTLESMKPPLDIDPNQCLSPGQSQQHPSSNIVPPVNPLPSPSPGQNQPPLTNIIPPINPLHSPSLCQNRQSPSHSEPLLSPNANLSCTNPDQSSSHSSPVMSHRDRLSKTCSKRDQRGPKCQSTSSRHKAVLKKKETPALMFDPMVEEGSGDKRLMNNLKEVINLFSGDLDYKQLADMDLLDVLETKGITFEDPPWWPK